MNKIYLIIITLLVLNPIVSAENTIYFFYGEGCPHCEEQTPFMQQLEREYNISVVYLETWHNKTNAELFVEFAKAYNISLLGVPATFIGDQAFIGYINKIEIEEAVNNCLKTQCNIKYVPKKTECLYGECCGAHYKHTWFYDVQYYCSMPPSYEPTKLGLIVAGVILGWLMWEFVIKQYRMKK